MTPDPKYPFKIPTADGAGRPIRVQVPLPKPAPGKKVAKKAPRPAPPVEDFEDPQAVEERLANFHGESENYRREPLMLRFTDMQVDPRYQRGENPSEIKHIADNHRPAALGTPVISGRTDEDGEVSFWVLDGQQRRAGSLLVGYNELLLCDVHWNLTLAEEAQLFLDLNYRRDITAAGKFKSALVALEPEALAIAKILDDLGIMLSDPRGFTAVAKARALVRRRNGFEHFRWALETLQSVYDKGNGGGMYDGRLVDGMAMFIRHHEGRFKQTDLEVKLRRGGDEGDLLIAAQALRKVHSMNVGTAVANAAARLFNHHRSKNKLPLIGFSSEPNEYDEFEYETE